MTTIRAARIDDDGALHAIDRATWSTQVSPGGPPDPAVPFFTQHVAPADVLVAEVAGRIAGYVSVRPMFPIPSAAHVYEIGSIAVDPAVQRRGVGRRLIEATVDESRERGARRLLLRVLGHNASARALYESCGFEVEVVLRELFLLDGRYIDDVIMARDLVGPRP